LNTGVARAGFGICVTSSPSNSNLQGSSAILAAAAAGLVQQASAIIASSASEAVKARQLQEVDTRLKAASAQQGILSASVSQQLQATAAEAAAVSQQQAALQQRMARLSRVQQLLLEAQQYYLEAARQALERLPLGDRRLQLVGYFHPSCVATIMPELAVELGEFFPQVSNFLGLQSWGVPRCWSRHPKAAAFMSGRLRSMHAITSFLEQLSSSPSQVTAKISQCSVPLSRASAGHFVGGAVRTVQRGRELPRSTRAPQVAGAAGEGGILLTLLLPCRTPDSVGPAAWETGGSGSGATSRGGFHTIGRGCHCSAALPSSDVGLSSAYVAGLAVGL
jgi:hypothetical protein